MAATGQFSMSLDSIHASPTYDVIEICPALVSEARKSVDSAAET
jgi:hypothetical protein